MKERNIALDYLKVGLAVLVVAIHFPPLGDVSAIGFLLSDGIARMAVPTFFVINGYFAWGMVGGQGKVQWKYFRRLLVMYACWMVIYLPAYAPGYSTLADWLAILKQWITSYRQLWYLQGMMAGALMLVVARRLKMKVGPAFLAGLIVLYAAYWALTCFTESCYDLRAFGVKYQFRILMAFPFMAIGYALREGGTWLRDPVMRRPVAILSAGLALVVAEALAKYFFWNRGYAEIYLSALWIAPVLFIVFNDRVRTMSTDGFFGELSSSIYFLHIFGVMLPGLDTLASVDRFLIVLMLTLVASIPVIALNRKFKVLF